MKMPAAEGSGRDDSQLRAALAEGLAAGVVREGDSMPTEKPTHSCELCRTLGDVIRGLNPDQYIWGPEVDTAEAIQAALRKHLERVGKERG